ncbi:MAG: DNA alkylation repair protein [Vicingus serpentipes]|nr:DNA alkylation repair protein [Vicingus serpentipes]
MNLKDEFDKTFIVDLSCKISTQTTAFNQHSFEDSLLNDLWEKKELKERIRAIAEVIHSHLQFSYIEQTNILSKIAPNYKGLKGLIFPEFIQLYGLNDVPTSFKAMELFTQYSTAEFAIRPFIEKYPKESHQQLLTWSLSDNYHLRRLASEGSRPRLPWGRKLIAFIKKPQPNIPILENLKNDDSLYVRKSVANHLNDISKDHPNLVLDLAKKWLGTSKHSDWIVKHALRTLLKKGDKKALAIFGLDDSKGLEIKDLTLSKSKIKIGEFVHFQFKLINQSNQQRSIRLEYSVNYIKANGSSSKKKFQLSELSLNPNTKKAFKRKQWFKELSTRKHYPGNHIITIIVNGDEKESVSLSIK